MGGGDALTYRQNGQSTETEIEFEVPAGGVAIMNNNTATSPGRNVIQSFQLHIK